MRIPATRFLRRVVGDVLARGDTACSRPAYLQTALWFIIKLSLCGLVRGILSHGWWDYSGRHTVWVHSAFIRINTHFHFLNWKYFPVTTPWINCTLFSKTEIYFLQSFKCFPPFFIAPILVSTILPMSGSFAVFIGCLLTGLFGGGQVVKSGFT